MSGLKERILLHHGPVPTSGLALRRTGCVDRTYASGLRTSHPVTAGSAASMMLSNSVGVAAWRSFSRTNSLFATLAN